MYCLKQHNNKSTFIMKKRTLVNNCINYIENVKFYNDCRTSNLSRFNLRKCFERQTNDKIN